MGFADPAESGSQAEVHRKAEGEVMTRAEANELIRQSLTADQLSEFEYLINCQQESIDDEIERFGECETEVSDYVDVLIEVVDRADSAIAHEEDPKWRKQARADRKAYERLMLKIGYYRPATPHEIENTMEFTSRGGMRKAKFLQIDGVKVTADRSFSVFLDHLK